jgi:dihydrofolate reductase
MARLVFGMNQSLDGYVDHMAFGPSPRLFRHFIEEAQAQTGSIYGRKIYEIMRYWDKDHPEWDAERRAFGEAWRRQPKWVVSRTLKTLGLIDEYRIYLHPVVLGGGTPYFAGPRPPLRLLAHERIDEDVLRLRYLPA